MLFYFFLNYVILFRGDVSGNKIEKLADIIKNSKHLVFFTGAGVSTESGLKSFRGKMDYIVVYTKENIDLKKY